MKVFLPALLVLFPIAASADESGWFGFSQEVAVSWLMNVEYAKVNYVAPNSPASRAGIAVGDQFTSIEDCAIPGCGAMKAKKLMLRAPGEKLKLRLRRPTGEEYSVELIAEKPTSK